MAAITKGSMDNIDVLTEAFSFAKQNIPNYRTHRYMVVVRLEEISEESTKYAVYTTTKEDLHLSVAMAVNEFISPVYYRDTNAILEEIRDTANQSDGVIVVISKQTENSMCMNAIPLNNQTFEGIWDIIDRDWR